MLSLAALSAAASQAPLGCWPKVMSNSSPQATLVLTMSEGKNDGPYALLNTKWACSGLRTEQAAQPGEGSDIDTNPPDPA